MAIDPPWRLDPLQNIVNVSWGGDIYILLQCRAIGIAQVEDLPHLYPTFDDGSPGNVDDPSKVVDLILTLEVAAGGSILYSRQFTSEEQVGTTTPTGPQDYTVYYRTYSEAIAASSKYITSSYHAETLIFHGESFAGTIFNISGETFYEFRPFLALSSGDETSYDSYFDVEVAGGAWAYAWHKRKFTVAGSGEPTPILQPTFEAVYLIKPPSIKIQTDPPVQPATIFTITTTKFIMDAEILLYIRKGLKVDTANTAKGIFFGAPTGRVYFPFVWGIPEPPAYDVEFNYCWDEGLFAKGVGSSYQYAVTRDKHLITPPDPENPDKSIKDVIYQLYPKTLGDGDTWDVYGYCDTLSFTATFFSGPASWLGLTITTKPPAIAADA